MNEQCAACGGAGRIGIPGERCSFCDGSGIDQIQAPKSSEYESLSVAFLRARFANEEMPWTRPYVESLINRIEELTKQRDEGWGNFYKLRKQVAEERYPGMTGVLTPSEPGEKRCSCVWFTQDGATVIQHLKDDPNCPVHGELVKAASACKHDPQLAWDTDKNRRVAICGKCGAKFCGPW